MIHDTQKFSSVLKNSYSNKYKNTFPCKDNAIPTTCHEGMWRRMGIIMLAINLRARLESAVGSMPRLLYHCAGYSTNTETHSDNAVPDVKSKTHPTTTIQMKIS